MIQLGGITYTHGQYIANIEDIPEGTTWICLDFGLNRVTMTFWKETHEETARRLSDHSTRSDVFTRMQGHEPVPE